MLQDISLDLTVAQLQDKVRQLLPKTMSFPPPFRNYPFDTFKIETQAFGFKTNDTVIKQDQDQELILRDQQTLIQSGVKNETEISFFKLEDYVEYKKNPLVKW